MEHAAVLTRYGLNRLSRHCSYVDIEMVKSLVTDLRWALQDNEVSRTKSFLTLFIKSIVVDGREIVINYTMPMMPDSKWEDKLRVLSIDTVGGAEVAIGRTFILTFNLES